MENAIKLALKDYSTDEIKTSIDHYAEAYHSDYEYCSYKWGIDTFFERKGGYTKFMNDGDKLLSYLGWRNGENSKTQKKKAVTGFHNFEQKTSKYSAEQLEDVAPNIRRKKMNKDNS